MVSDQEIARGVETLLRQSDPTSVTTLNGVVRQLEAKMGLDLSHKAPLIRDLLLRSDHFALQHFPQTQMQQQPQHFSPHFVLNTQQQQQQHHHHHHDLNFRQPHPHLQPQPPPPPKPATAPELPKESAPPATKKRGGTGGLNKVCGVSPELQAIVGQPALPRTEIVKQLWAYIKKNNLQDPNNKRKIICDNALQLVFETDCTDMFKMNKLLAKHIIPCQSTKESSQAKRMKINVDSSSDSTEPGSRHVIISEALGKFLGTGEREMQHSEAHRRVWEYIKINHLEDPASPMAVNCDEKLRELLGCESISALGVPQMLDRHHLLKKS
ncbi:protein TRI1 [Punica granatum]|uniref:Protein TRI1 n=1 Tax=Punica granatum TaxID=22663 RepID=A0A218XF68_PUNGR|nr:protein TRI1 [Punica granatum]XP_031394570.1 protein TRI1 [Punica granatum]OWM83339.1 hypothetical protein CDL15_Pgr012820 [Punica granatum]